MIIKEHMLTAINASIEAGRAILNVYDSDKWEVEEKSDRSPLTLADRRSNEIIESALSETGFPILSEEGKDVSYEERRNWETFWLIDPLDGTKEFINKNGEFTVNIAYIEDGRPIMGVIYVPVKKELYFGSEKYGAFKLKDCGSAINNLDKIIDRACKLPALVWNKESFCVVGSRSHMSEPTLTFIDKLKKDHSNVKLISRGSSLKLCMIAEGGAQIYPRFAPTMEWDTAAGQAIVEFSGGVVLNYPELTPLSYNKKELRNPWFIVALNRTLLN